MNEYNERILEFNRRQAEAYNKLTEHLGMNDTPQHHVIVATRKQERRKCIAIIEEEIARGKSLIGLLDHKGKPIYSDEAMTIGLEVLEYVLQRIKEME